MGTYCWCVHVHALQTSTLCDGAGTHRPLLVYRFSAASLHNCMPDSFSLDTYHLEHICEDTQSRIFELCSSRGGLRFCRAAISSKWERRVGDRGADPLPFDNNFTTETGAEAAAYEAHVVQPNQRHIMSRQKERARIKENASDKVSKGRQRDAIPFAKQS